MSSLAYAEMKLILARIVYNFDLELVDKAAKWNEQEVYILWRKGPLMVHAKERV
jgi:cytochrome P450